MLILDINKLYPPCAGHNFNTFRAKNCLTTLLLTLLLLVSAVAHADPFSINFGYEGVKQADISVFPQWVNVLNTQDLNSNPQDSWHQFLDSIRNQSAHAQLDAVNRFVNRQNYVIDIDNYGAEDHWAKPAEFLQNGGDCEDFAILKFFSLRLLGWPPEKLRLVVVQDTKMGQPHAVLAVATERDVLILDNQAPTIVSAIAVPHYTPVYSISGEKWWLHLPNS